MNSSDTVPLTKITVADGSTEAKAKDIAAAPPSAPQVPAAPRRPLLARLFRRDKKIPARGWKRCLAIFDFILRLLAIAALTTAAVAMGTADETLPFFTQNYQFYANFADLPALLLLVIVDAIAAGYLCLSIPLSIVSIIRPVAACPRLFLFIFDLVAVALTTAAGSAAAAIIYLAHTGNSKANWVAICMRFQGFCQQSSGAVVASFVGTIILMLMVAMSALALRRH